MYMIFLHPQLLVLAPVVAVAGWFLLRKADVPERTFTILEFWPVEINKNIGKNLRIPDWPWMLILSAAVLATMALSVPRIQWQAPQAVPRQAVIINAVGRSLPGNAGAVDLFVKVPALHPQLPYTLLVHGDDPEKPERIISRTVTAEKLSSGTDVVPVPASQQFAITLKQGGYTIARATLRRLPGVQKIAAHFIGPPPRVFLKLLSSMPGLELHAGTSGRGIWIVNQRDFNPKSLAGIKNSAIVLSGHTPGPLLSPGAVIEFKPPQSPIAVGHGKLLNAVNPSHVAVQKIIRANLGPGWHVLMRVTGHPWLAERNDPIRNITWLWLSSPLRSAWTDWPHHASFVIFFTNVIARLQSIPGHAMQADAWRTVPENQPGIATANTRIAPGFAGVEAPSNGRSGLAGNNPRREQRVLQIAAHLTSHASKPMPPVQTISLNIFIAMMTCTCLLIAITALALRDRTSSVKSDI